MEFFPYFTKTTVKYSSLISTVPRNQKSSFLDIPSVDIIHLEMALASL
jgi:hypothetical protein